MPTILDLALVAVLAVAWPLYERFVDWPAFQRRVRRDPSGARVFEYRRSIAQQWVLAAGVLAAWRSAGRGWPALGLRAPEGWRLWIAAVLLAAFAALQAWQVLAIERSLATRERLRDRLERLELASVLPRTRRELGWMVMLSLTAGFVEETIFRGYLMAVLAPPLGWWGAAAISLAAFGVLHAYQGNTGLIRTAALGAVMMLMVTATRSLLPAMVLHALIDLGSGAVSCAVLEGVPEAPASA